MQGNSGAISRASIQVLYDAKPVSFHRNLLSAACIPTLLWCVLLPSASVFMWAWIKYGLFVRFLLFVGETISYLNRLIYTSLDSSAILIIVHFPFEQASRRP
jgi:hypothetical protein